MKNIIATVIGIALVVVLIIAVILPISNKSKVTGEDALTDIQNIDKQLNDLKDVIEGSSGG